MSMPIMLVPPKPPEKERSLPTEEQLLKLIELGSPDIAQQLIDTHKLSYRIEDGKLLGALTGTERWLKRFITVDRDTLALKEDVRKLAKVNDEVVITGETGTGKELIARAMIGDRTGEFKAVNCAGLPAELIESELFGHVKGSFTGAIVTKDGLFTAAKDGVLFLDEVGELPLQVQGKLLRAIQDKKVRKVGSNAEEDINCKLVCATHCNLRQMIHERTFRLDLYARLSTFELHIEPLKRRLCDIEPILFSLPKGKEFIEACVKVGKNLEQLDTTLNVRSLQQAVKRYTVLGRI